MNLESEIAELFKSYPDVLYGFADTSFSDYSPKYSSALVYAVPHRQRMQYQNYDEELFQAYIHDLREVVIEINDKLVNIFNENNIVYERPASGQSSEETLIAPFSFKHAAILAGLGWIGKNDVLITDRYGPRVRLAAILVDYDFPKKPPIIESRCPDDCLLCIEACPHKALKSRQWNINTNRSELIDYQLCNKQRSLYIKTHNRKHSCGLCMVACPIGV